MHSPLTWILTALWGTTVTRIQRVSEWSRDQTDMQCLYS